MTEDEAQPVASAYHGPLVAIGGLAMLCAMCADGLAVLGRHTGFAVIGAIEIFQASLVISLSCALLLASLTNRHATVDLLLSRVPPRAVAVLSVIGKASLAVTFALLSAGAIWAAVDLWGTREQTELLGIPVLPLRLVWAAACAIAAVHFATRFVLELRR